MTHNFLDNVYDHIGAGVEEFYDDWAATYDAEVGENGYVTPTRCARALAAVLVDPAAPILDFGCGTGLSGHALRACGFTTLDGMDLAAEMLDLARQKNLYRSLVQVSPDAPLPVEVGSYAAIAAIGVIGPGAAPLSVLDTLISLLAPSGLLVFSFNDHALQDPAYDTKVKTHIAQNTLKLLHREHGPHLPARGICSTVYLAEKL